MKVVKPVFGWALVLYTVLGLFILSILFASPTPVLAAAPTPQPQPPGPDRFAAMSVEINTYGWWLAAWQDKNIYCSFVTDHEGLPTASDVFSACGKDLYTDWIGNSNACDKEDSTTCPGYYFIQVSKKPLKRDITIKLPPPVVQISLENCSPDDRGWCMQQPNLVLVAKEPLPNESISSIAGTVGSDPFMCKGSSCTFKLSNSKSTGIRLTFWANSTYGDSSQEFNALVRVINDGESDTRLTPRWYVDVISSQWTGAPIASCASTWESFPPTEGPPKWLSTPISSDDLESNIPYDYLAANLISQGVANAGACPNGGLNQDGSANSCGLKAVAPAAREWQNRFDKLIFKIARERKIPAQLLKNLFSRESQFWPGVFRNSKDVGLGQMTEGGADTTLLWNPSFYEQFCPLVLDENLCKTKGFSNLNPAHQKLLRGALVGSVDARCETCPLGLDLSRADFSISIFAHTLLANCEQAGKIVQNVTNGMPGLSVDYETLWRFTLVNYNAGSGCLANAITQAYNPSAQPPLSWDAVASALEVSCPGAANYVTDVSKETAPLEPAPTPSPGDTNG